MIDANGGTLLPGLVDAHCHPFEYGWLKRSVDLRDTSNLISMRLRLQSAIRRSPPGAWVSGMGWNNEGFPGGAMPTKKDIDDLSPNNPTVLGRVCGHVALVNSRAIQVLRLGDLQGPEFERGPDGELTGIVKEGGLSNVYSALPRSPEVSAADLLGVEVEAAGLGLTGLGSILSPEGYEAELGAVLSISSSSTPTLRHDAYVPLEALGFLQKNKVRERLRIGRLQIAGVKIYTDGSLGARTAALREPYSDDPQNSGMLRMPDDELEEKVRLAEGAGFRTIIHAIGDRGIEQAIDAVSAVAGPRNEYRHRIEHASLLPPDLLARMAKENIPASVQPRFITSDTWAAARVGEERARHLYPLKSMLSAGIKLSGSSDSPIESLSPILAVWSAMVRGEGAPHESLNLSQALGLYAAGVPRSKNDFTLLDSDIEGMHPALLRRVGVAATIVEGEILFSRVSE